MSNDEIIQPSPVRMSWSADQLRDATRCYMLHYEGTPKDLTDEQRDRWHERLGLLTHFVHCLWANKFE